MKKEDGFGKLPQKHLSESEKQYISLVIEKSKLHRERAMLVLDKGLLLFFAFLAFSVIAREQDLITDLIFKITVISSICVLLLSITPYINISKKEEEKLDKILEDLTG